MVFDPADGSLSLRRCAIGVHTTEQTLAVPTSVPGIGGTSISLPSRPSLGRVGAALPAPGIALGARSFGAAPDQDKPTAIVGHESEVATWNLKRGRGWPVVKVSVRSGEHISETPSSSSVNKYVAQVLEK